jgi:hypothetical protein
MGVEASQRQRNEAFATSFNTTTASNRGGVGKTKQRGVEMGKWEVEETPHQ